MSDVTDTRPWADPVDWLDPNTWGVDLPYRALWIDPLRNLFAIVDREDYDWALQWTWSSTPSKRGENIYVTRSTRLEGANGPQTKLYLHKEILKRTFALPPSPEHIIADHINANSLDNRRRNLRWATPSGNAINRWATTGKTKAPRQEHY